jgi:hypothetical protein
MLPLICKGERYSRPHAMVMNESPEQMKRERTDESPIEGQETSKIVYRYSRGSN